MHDHSYHLHHLQSLTITPHHPLSLFVTHCHQLFDKGSFLQALSKTDEEFKCIH